MRKILIIVMPLLAVGLLALFFMSRPSVKNGDVLDNGISNSGSTPVTSNRNEAPAISSRDSIVSVARTFAERYASTSTSNPGANMVSALPLASSSLKASFERILAATPTPSTDNTVVTSRVMSYVIQYLDEVNGRAGITLSLQRSERTGNKTPRTFNQDLTIQVIREQGSWKVQLAVFAAV